MPMITKTISGHYDTAFSLAHNNRVLMSKNVAPTRTVNNYTPIMAGMPVTELYPDYKSLQQQWSDYRVLCDLYWGRLHLERAELLKLIAAERQRHWEYLRLIDNISDCGLFSLLLLPMIITLAVLEAQENSIALERYEMELNILRMESDCFRCCQADLRDALRVQDLECGTELLSIADQMVGHCENLADDLWGTPERFATEEEIYNKVFEPSFQAFQSRQRKCRRYNGTYLEQIRERTAIAQKKRTGKADRLRVTAEAIEIVFTIGDMDNTGYENAPEDAKKSEVLLSDFCQHLLSDSHICAVTDRDLRNPHWRPPFKHGLIVLNLVAHYDEATPGVHLTVIPYTSGCKRGPDKQPAMGKAFAGMGYKSEWIEILDQNGNPITKTDRFGNPIKNQDGSIRTERIPHQQGIIDWIEHQKMWLQDEMYRRYGWEREYKGSHPRGNLSTPDYKAARAKERSSEAERQMEEAVKYCYRKCLTIANSLHQSVNHTLENSTGLEIILNYAKTCSDERFSELLDEATAGMRDVSAKEKAEATQMLQDIINEATKRRKNDNGNRLERAGKRRFENEWDDRT